MTTFPNQLDTFQNPSANTSEDAAGLEHDVQHANANDAIAALQRKVGVNNSGDAASLDAVVGRLLAVVFAGSARYRFKDGTLQLWDDGYAAADISKPWAALRCLNGALQMSGPIAD